MGQGSTISDPSEQLLELLTTAYEQANAQPPEWDGQTYYVNFGDDENRNWDDARKYGFVSAGGGAWYSRTLKQLQTGNRIYVYIPKGNGVGGYVGVGDVTAPPVPAAEFLVTENGKQVPITDVADADMTYDSNSDPEMAEWLAPVKWLTALPREQAVKDPDFFANQNSAVRLTHGYTIRQLRQAFGIDDASSPARH